MLAFVNLFKYKKSSIKPDKQRHSFFCIMNKLFNISGLEGIPEGEGGRNIQKHNTSPKQTLNAKPLS